MNILLVDDDNAYRMVAAEFLRDKGWNVFIAVNGQDALDRLKSISVDIIVSDVYMPVMDGLKLHRLVRLMPAYRSLPFLFVSAFDDQLTLEAVKDQAIDGFVRKGTVPAELAGWISYLTTPVDRRPTTPPFRPQR